MPTPRSTDTALVLITDVNLSAAPFPIAVGFDRHRQNFKIDLRVLSGIDHIPEVGEYYWIERRYGWWTIASLFVPGTDARWAAWTDGSPIGPTHHGVSAYLGSNTPVSSGINSVTWLLKDYDTDGYHSSGAPTRFTVPAGLGGYYRLLGQVYWAGSSTGLRNIQFRKNGATTLRALDESNNPPSGAFSQSASMNLSLVAGDYLEMRIYQNSGGSLNAYGTYTFFQLDWLGA